MCQSHAGVWIEHRYLEVGLRSHSFHVTCKHDKKHLDGSQKLRLLSYNAKLLLGVLSRVEDADTMDKYRVDFCGEGDWVPDESAA